MILPNYEIHMERLEELKEKVNLESDDLKYNLNHVCNEIWRNSDLSNHKPRADRLILLLHVAREDFCNTIQNLQMIVEELDDIEDEVERHEVNNAGE